MKCKWCRKKCDACRLNRHGKEAAQAVIESTPLPFRWLMWEDRLIWITPLLVVIGFILNTMIGLSPLLVDLFTYIPGALAWLYFIGWYIIYRRRGAAAEKAHDEYLKRGHHEC